MKPKNISTQDSSSVLWATISWYHMGLHSGMRPLFAEVQALAPGFARPMAQMPLVYGSAYIWKDRVRRLFKPALPWKTQQRDNPLYTDRSWWTEHRLHDEVMRAQPRAVVLESIEEQYYLTAKNRLVWPKTSLVAVSHLPAAWWRLHNSNLERFKSLDTLITLASNARPFWVSILGEERVVTIPHGVDTDFFCPDETVSKLSADDGILRVVFAGLWMRDFDTLANISALADQLDLPICFEMVVPLEFREKEACYRIAMSPRVRWHAGLSDESLRQLYRQSDLVLLTLTDATANNALLEGMACGLPIVMTDVGGVRDYARETFTDFLPPRDAEHALEVLRSYIGPTDKLKRRGLAAREHVSKHFSWKKIAGEYLTLLRRLMDSP